MPTTIPSGRYVAVYGGSFNPPHLAHLFTLQALLTRSDVSEVWLLPCSKHAFAKELLSFNIRVDLLKQVIKDLHRVTICDIENEVGHSGYTFDTLAKLSERYPSKHFKLVIGADNLSEAHRWHRFDDIIDRWGLLVINRLGHEKAAAHYQDHPGITMMPYLISISSSEIRTALLDPPYQWNLPPLCWLPHSLQQQVTQLYGPKTPSSRRLITDESGSYIDRHTHSEDVTIDQSNLNISILGSGRCGQALYTRLSQLEIPTHLYSLRELHSQIQGTFCTLQQLPIYQPLVQSSIWLITCRDQDLKSWASELANQLINYPVNDPFIVLHCSGATPHEVLAPLRDRGALIGRMHPLMTLRGQDTREDSRALSEASFMVSGDRQALPNIHALVSLIGQSSFQLPSQPAALSEEIRLQLYHASATLGANLSTVPLLLSELLFEKLGFQRAVTKKTLAPLFRHALAGHLSDSVDPTLSHIRRWHSLLTGPLIRGDQQTIVQHVEALKLFHQLDPDLGENLLDAYQHLNDLAGKLIKAIEVSSEEETSH